MNREYRFSISPYHYVVDFDKAKSEFTFFVESSDLPCKQDPFDRFGESSTEAIWDRGAGTKHIFKVKAEILKHIEHCVNHFKPKFFYYDANEPSKKPVYDKIAVKLANKLDYSLEIYDNKCMFYRR